MLPGQESCNNCPAGYECPNANSKAECGVGFYSTDGDAMCTACESGTYAENTGTVTASEIRAN